MFWNKKKEHNEKPVNLSSSEFENLHLRIVEISNRLKAVEFDVQFLSEKVLKKLKSNKEKIEEESETNKYNDGFDSLRGIGI